MKNTLIISLFGILFTLNACIKPVEWDEIEKSSGTLVVEGRITDLPQKNYVILRKTLPIVTNESPEPVSGAQVEITDGAHTYLLEERENGVYLPHDSVRGHVGKEYKLIIKVDGKVYQASAYMPEAPTIDPVKINESVIGDDVRSFTLPANFGADTPYLYELKYQVSQKVYDHYPDNWEPKKWFLRRMTEGDTLILDTTFYVHDVLEPSSLFLYGEHEYEGILKGSEMIETVYSMTEEHYNFVRNMFAETEWKGAGVVGSIPADVEGNVSNGAFGYFSASSVKTITTVVQ